MTVCFGVPALIIGFLGINIPGFTTSGDGLQLWEALALVLGISLVLVLTTLLTLRGYVNRAVAAQVAAKVREEGGAVGSGEEKK